MNECLFCKIRDGEIAADLIYEDDDVVAFRDVNPQSPTHVLVVPRKHVATLNDLTEEDSKIVGQMYLAAKEIAEAEGIAEDGYRTIINCNSKAGQTVFHIHLHLMGGRAMTWPPG